MSSEADAKPPHEYFRHGPAIEPAKGKIVCCRHCGHQGLVSSSTEVATCSCCGERKQMR